MPLKISRILHAGYVFESDDTIIAFDTIFENPFSHNCQAFPDVQFDLEQIRQLKFDAVFISHYHDDHCSLESLNLLDRKTPIYIYCLFEEIFSMLNVLGFANVYSLKINEKVVIGSIEVIPRRALDAEVDSIFHIKAAGLNFLNVVDSWIDEETLSLLAQSAPWDIVLWPFQTMREIEVLSPRRAATASDTLPIEWTRQLKELNPRYLVPSSCQFRFEDWSWYNKAFFPISYQQFSEQIQMDFPHTNIVRLNPGKSIVLGQKELLPATALSWVIPVGEQDVDYDYQPGLVPPPTSEISRHFAPLTLYQQEIVFEYCSIALLEKYRAIGPSQDVYFSKPRLWRLSLYDHAGEITHFYYKLNADDIELATGIERDLSWTTEISISKLFAALEYGEALTSLYMRINDVDFALEIENEIESVDVVEDPLIRCLYTGEFGAYQSAQLKRIKSEKTELSNGLLL